MDGNKCDLGDLSSADEDEAPAETPPQNPLQQLETLWRE